MTWGQWHTGTKWRDTVDLNNVTDWDNMTSGLWHTGGKWRDTRPQWHERLWRDDVRTLDGVVPRQKHLNYLMIVVLCREYQRRYVRWKLTFLLRSEERIVLRSSTFDPLLTCHVVRMFYDDFHDLCRTLQTHYQSAKHSIQGLLTTTTTPTTTFYRATACWACYMLSQIRLSVCLSVCPSHGWISQKRLKLGSCNFHHTVAPHPSPVYGINFIQKFWRSPPKRRHQTRMGWGNELILSVF